MNHIDPETLELFVLGSDRVPRGEIEAHLRECHGCREFVERMEGSYRAVEARFRSLEENPASGSLERVHSKPAPRYEGVAAPVRDYRPLTRVQRMRALVRRHPVVAGSGAFGVMALTAFLLWLPGRSLLGDAQPQYVHPNVEIGALEAYSRDHEKLWALPAAGLTDVQEGMRRGLTYFAVVDLDADGRNEVATTVFVPGLGDLQAPPVLVFSADKRLLHAWKYDTEVIFDGRQYAPPFGAHFLVAGDFSGSGRYEIIVQIDGGRSPSGIIRYSGDGGILGEYWHYGQIHALYAEDVNGDGRSELLVCGQNDIGEKEGARYAFLAVLDPARLLGRGMSVCSPGFPMEGSRAELLYMRFPNAPLPGATARADFIQAVKTSGGADPVLRSVWFRAATEPPDVFLLEYLLDRKFACVRVRSTDQTEEVRARLLREGGQAEKEDAAYLDRLRTGVRYFDGRGWRREVVWLAPPA